MKDDFAALLEALGFYDYATTEQAAQNRAALHRAGWAGVFSIGGRMFAADAEDLAEAGFGTFLENVTPFLAKQRVMLADIQDRTESGYEVSTNLGSVLLYSAEELNRTDQPGLIWGLTAARGFGFVNRLLAAAGSKERLYAVNGGNDMSALFLTMDLAEIISDHPDAVRSDTPYLPTEEYPRFGQPA